MSCAGSKRRAILVDLGVELTVAAHLDIGCRNAGLAGLAVLKQLLEGLFADVLSHTTDPEAALGEMRHARLAEIASGFEGGRFKSDADEELLHRQARRFAEGIFDTIGRRMRSSEPKPETPDLDEARLN